MAIPNDDPEHPPEKWREVRYRHSSNLPQVLRELNCSLLISTYQAGKLLAIGTADNERGEPTLHFSFHNFDQAMGVAVSPRKLAVGAKGAVWFHDGAPEIAPTLNPTGRFDRCYLARRAHVTGGIHCHEMAWDVSGELWVVNTLFSCLATLHSDHSFVPRWQPPFITQLAGEDRCHLNGLAMRDGRPALVTMMSETNEPAGWRPKKESTGLIMDLATHEVVTRGLAMPHSPRLRDDKLFVLNSGCGALEVVDQATGQREVVEKLPGYARGLAFCGPAAFIGLSKIRETAVFGGLPIAAEREGLKCGVGVVDLRSGQTIATLEFESGVEEIFDVQVLPETRCPAICGPRPDQDAAQDVWLVPRPDQVDRLLSSSSPVQHQPPSGAGFSGPRSHAAQLPELSVAALIEQALALQSQRRVGEAIAILQQAARRPPLSATVLNHLGNAYQDAGDQLTALECYRQAVHVDATFGPALQNFGYVLVAQGRTDEGRSHLRQAQVVQPADVNHVLIATSMPIVYDSQTDVNSRRNELLTQVKKLANDKLVIDTTNTLVPTNFFAVYQGGNDCPLHRNLGRIYKGVNLTKGKKARDKKAQRRGGKLRVGFLSAYLRDHTIGRLNIGRIERLPRDEFEVVVLSIGQHGDPLAERFRKTADKYVTIPREVARARQMIAAEECDLLMFTDVGMDALSYTLAFSRMAPVQLATWGHPVTTGSPTIDFFLSSNLLETPEAPEHYTEKLILPPSLATYYERPKLTGPRKSRGDFGLPVDATFYGCPQTLFKFHPEYDEILAGILRADPRGELLLIEGRTANWTRLLKERFARVMPEVVERIRWLPALQNEDFLQLLVLCDVSLDPLHFGGGNTTYEALAVGTPVITLPGPYLRSRITRAQYERMAGGSLAGSPAPVAETKEDYIRLAVELANAGEARDIARSWIAEHAGVLFENASDVDDFAAALRSAIGS